MVKVKVLNLFVFVEYELNFRMKLYSLMKDKKLIQH